MKPRVNRRYVFLLTAVLFTLFASQPFAYDSTKVFAHLTIGDTLDDFGRFIASAGDINSDGYDDFWVQRSLQQDWSDFYLYRGGTQLDTVPLLIWHLSAFRLYNVGDLNDDQFDDFLVVYNDSVVHGASYFGLHYGGPMLSSTPALRFPIHPFNGNPYYLGSEHMVIGGQDFDGDGKPDLLIGEPTGRTGNGVYLYTSQPGFDTIADYHFYYGNDADIQQSGQGVGFLPNFDGHSYIVLGVQGASQEPTKPGRVVMFRAGADLDTVADLVFHNPRVPSDYAFGSDICVPGDLNGDGYTDFVEHAYGAPGYVYFGGVPTDTVADLRILPTFQALNSAGDFNHDGFADLFIRDEPFQGRGWLYYGGAQMDEIVDSIIYPPISVINFSHGGACLGDVNGDGIDDLGVGALGFESGWWPGQVLIYTGYDSVLTDVPDDGLSMPSAYQLLTNYPNPFNPGTTIQYSVPVRCGVEIAIFNTLGQRVTLLDHSTVSAGTHTLQWNGTSQEGTDVPTGVYFCRLTTLKGTLNRKLLLIR